MASNSGIRASEEIDRRKLIRNAKPSYQRFADAVREPATAVFIYAGIALICLGVPALTKFGFLAIGLISLMNVNHFRRFPVRIPKAADIQDPSETKLKKKGFQGGDTFERGKGIFYFGSDRLEDGKKEQVWASDSDARTHAFALGTTGSGKTQALLSWAFNTLSWGSGFIYIDGKADNELIYQAYAMHRRLGRTDDFFVINFMTGDSDAFENMRTAKRLSNTINPMSSGSSNSLTQLVSSLMAEAGGDSAMWQGLAIGMVNAVIIGLCYKRFREGFTIDAGVLRDHIELSKLIELTKEFSQDPAVPKDLVLTPLKTYLMNLPGFDWGSNLEGGSPVSEDTKKQHDFRSMQFLRQLTMIADTYGAVFKAQIPEVSMLDIVLKRRSVIVCIPSLEKSEEESTGVGKLVVSALRLMMSKTLGSDVEGDYDDVVGSKPTKAPSPYVAIFDELGYYFTKGMAVSFAQARGLGFGLFAAAQDLSALMKGSNKEEAESVIANTKIKITLALEDPQSTADLIIKTAGEAFVSEVAGYEGRQAALTSATYRDNLSATVQSRARVTLGELQDMDSGQSILIWRGKIVRMQNFYVFAGPGAIKHQKAIKLNRLVSCFQPGVEEFKDKAIKLPPKEVPAAEKIVSIMLGLQQPDYRPSSDEIGDELLIAPSTSIDLLTSPSGIESDLGLYHKYHEWFVSQENGTKKSKRSAFVVDSFIDGDKPSNFLPEISSDTFTLSFSEIFTIAGETSYPITPIIDETKLSLLSEEDVESRNLDDAWTLKIDDDVKNSLATIDKLLEAKESSSGTLKRMFVYVPYSAEMTASPAPQKGPSRLDPESQQSGY